MTQNWADAVEIYSTLFLRQGRPRKKIQARSQGGGQGGHDPPQWNLSPKKYGDGPYFFKKNRLRRAKIDWILEPIPKKFRLRRAEYLVT